MENTTENTSFFSSVCVEDCKGLCCDPWWGIISYTEVKEGGLSNIDSFRSGLLKGIKARAQRIMDAYVTDEEPKRPIFGPPERYNVAVRDIRLGGTAITVDLIAMFAFRCRFLSEDKACSIHPSFLGQEIRPPHCAFLGAPHAKPGEKGYCRIIHAAASGESVNKAIELEKKTCSRHLSEGVSTAEEAADRVIERLKSYASAHLSHMMPRQSPSYPGRNDPCHCGSGLKFKKCHGR